MNESCLTYKSVVTQIAKTKTCAHSHIDAQTDTQIDTYTQTHTHGQTDRQKFSHTDTQTDTHEYE